VDSYAALGQARTATEELFMTVTQIVADKYAIMAAFDAYKRMGPSR
jgi:hypothetical protein